MTEHPKQEKLGSPDLKVAGFQLWVHGRQFPECEDYYDGNWLNVTAHCGEVGASVWLTGSILMITDVVGWAEECKALAGGQSKEATLSLCEPNLCIQIKLLDSLGHMEMHVEITPDHTYQQHSFKFDIDQTFIPAIIKQCCEIEKEFTVRGK